MTFRLTIDTDTAAFTGDAYGASPAGERNAETARILREVADRLDAGDDFTKYRTLFDLNGNDVGRAAFKP